MQKKSRRPALPVSSELILRMLRLPGNSGNLQDYADFGEN
jgi:hypothetical protein